MEIAQFPAADRGRAQDALALASRRHSADQRQREPYANHLLRVTIRILSHYRVTDPDVACAALLLHNTGYLWIKKRRQYWERAEPTQELIAMARRANGPIYVKCFPRPALIAQEAVHLAAGKPVSDVIWDAEQARRRGAVATFCYQDK